MINKIENIIKIQKHETLTSCIKHWGVKWLIQAFCPASAFVSADRNEARNPQRFIHATVGGNYRKPETEREITT